ncbi:MAG: type II secretion system protein [Actinomycetia bacterium]|nr:type II secretion system protein [Actinomycetes bacterium]
MVNMMKARRRAGGRPEGDEGFTLTEVMVAIMIIGILAAVGIPTFLGARARAHDKAAQAPVLTALLSAETLNAQAGAFTAATTTALQAGVTSPTYLDSTTASTGPTLVSVYGHSSGFSAAVYSNSGTCYMLRQTSTGQTTYGTASGSGTCTGSTAWSAATAASW